MIRIRRRCLTHYPFGSVKSEEREDDDDDEEDADRDEREALEFAMANEVSNQYHAKRQGRGYQAMPNEFYHDGTRPWGPRSRSEDEEKIPVLTRTTPSPKFRIKSIPDAVFTFLLKQNSPVHITEIIAYLKTRKLLRKRSELHHYSIVHRSLSRQVAVFNRCDKGMFAVREGYKKHSPVLKLQKQEQEKIGSSTILDMVTETLRLGNATASQIYNHLKSLGFRGDFKIIRSTLDNKKFRHRKGIFSLPEQK